VRSALTSDPKKREYLEWLFELERGLNNYDDIKEALNAFREQSLSRSDSLWFLLKMARLYLDLEDSHKSLSYVDQAASSARELGTCGDFRDISQAYLQVKSYNSALEAASKACQKSMTRADTANTCYLYASIYNNRGVETYSSGDTSAGLTDFREAISHFTMASDLFPKWPDPLVRLQLIYHEYVIDYEKSLDFSLRLRALNPFSVTYAVNAIEARLTAGMFDQSAQEAEDILAADSLGERPLDIETRLAMRFILMASNVLKGDPLNAYAEFGSFKRDYTKPGAKTVQWVWQGTKNFLQNHVGLSPSQRDVLLSIIWILESEKDRGMIMMRHVEDQWKDLIKEAM
jgi:tetratricopeptide (TPR) repeat protein